MTYNFQTVNSVLQTIKNLYGPLTLSYWLSKPLRTVRTEFNPSMNIRAKQRNILSVDNDMQFTDHKLCLTDRQNPIRTIRTEFNPSKSIWAKQRNILSVNNKMQFTDRKLCLPDRQKPIRTVRTERTVNSVLRTIKNLYGPYELKGPLPLP